MEAKANLKTSGHISGKPEVVRMGVRPGRLQIRLCLHLHLAGAVLVVAVRSAQVAFVGTYLLVMNSP